MRWLGILLLIGAAALGFWGATFDPTVATDGSLTPPFGVTERVMNIDLVSWRLVIFIGSAATFVSGIVLLASDFIVDELIRRTAKPETPQPT